MDFLEIFNSGRYHRDMKILKILASNSKRFRVYGIFKKLQIDGDSGWPKISLAMFCWLKKLKNEIWIALKPTGIEL